MYSENSSSDVCQNDSTLLKDTHACECEAGHGTTDETCGETDGLSILNEFQMLYETRIQNINQEFTEEFDRTSAKLHTMEQWVRDLSEQNIMLVQTVEDLEQAASNRVKLLEEKLLHSSSIVSENMTTSMSTNETISSLSNRISQLEKDEKYLYQRISVLENDRKGLLELIRRARTENSWSTDGIEFSEIEPDRDIPAPLRCGCTCDQQEESNNENMQSLQLQVQQLQENERKLIVYQTKLEGRITSLSNQLQSKNETIDKYTSGLQDLQENVRRHSNLSEDLNISFANSCEDYNPDDNAVQYQNKTNLLLQEEREAIHTLKMELEKLINNSLNEKEKHQTVSKTIYEILAEIKTLLQTYKSQIVKYPAYTDNLKDFLSAMESQLDNLDSAFKDQTDTNTLYANGTIKNVAKNIDYLINICSDSERLIKVDGDKDYVECNKKTCHWKNEVTSLQDQIKVLQHETESKSAINNALKDQVKSVEEELKLALAKADHYRRIYSSDSTELNKKIRDLENTLNIQWEKESSLLKQLNDKEAQLQKSKDIPKSIHSDYGINGTVLCYSHNQLKHDMLNTLTLLQTVQNAIQSTSGGLQKVAQDLNSMVKMGGAHSCGCPANISYANALFTKSIVALVDELNKHEYELRECSQDVEKLKDILNSKDKILENMDVITRVQKDTIVMMQSELKEQQNKLEDKINSQDKIISQYEKEKNDLLKQNELQIQTIGHLQNAIVEAKRNLDHLGRRTLTDVSEMRLPISNASTYNTYRSVHDV